MLKKNSWKTRYFERELLKTSKRLSWFFFSHPVNFNGQKPFIGNFDDLIQGGFWVIPKTTFANLCKPIQDSILASSYKKTKNTYFKSFISLI